MAHLMPCAIKTASYAASQQHARAQLELAVLKAALAVPNMVPGCLQLYLMGPRCTLQQSDFAAQERGVTHTVAMCSIGPSGPVDLKTPKHCKPACAAFAFGEPCLGAAHVLGILMDLIWRRMLCVSPLCL